VVTLYVLAYKGKGFIDRLINWYEWGKYGHVMLSFSLEPVVGNTYIYESAGLPLFQAGAREGYLRDLHPDYGENDLDFYSIKALDTTADRIRDWCESKSGKCGYDYFALLGYILRDKYLDSKNRYVCSEYIFKAFEQAGVRLLNNYKAYQVTPSMLCSSPLLKKIERRDYAAAKKKGYKKQNKVKG